MKPVIVLGIDTPIGLTVVRELGRHGVQVHGIGRRARAIGAASRYCTTSSVRPAGDLIANWLPPLIAKTRAAAVMAISEDDLIALAALPSEIGGCRILTPRAGPLAIVLDKPRTLAVAATLGIDVPLSWLPQACDDFAIRAQTATYPLVAKWPDPAAVAVRLGKAGLALHKAEYIHDCTALVALLTRYRPIGCWPLIQTYCAGSGIGHMVHIDRGVVTLRFAHQRLHEWPPEGGISTLCETVCLSHNADLWAKSEMLLKEIGWQGAAMVEYRHDPHTNRFWLMEINGRFWGSLPLASHAGAQFAWETYRCAFRSDLPGRRDYRVGLRARYMIPETRRLLRVLFNRHAIADRSFRPRPWHDLSHYVAGFFDFRMRYFVFDPADPAPFFSDLKSIIRKALRRETR